MNVRHIPCNHYGWGHLTAVIECHDRQIMGYGFALRGPATQAEWTLESACLPRLRTLRLVAATPVLRSDNGFIFQNETFGKLVCDYRLPQMFMTPDTPQQNRLFELFFRSLKGECLRQQEFEAFEEAQQQINAWMQWYNEERPHQALKNQSPRQYGRKQDSLVA